jgi:hypothetical protein
LLDGQTSADSIAAWWATRCNSKQTLPKGRRILNGILNGRTFADLAESGEGLDMVGFASSVWPSYFNDAATDQAKWPEYHLSFCQSVNVKWPVDIGVFANLSPHTLSAAYPDIGALPQRERDMYFVVDQLVSNGSGSGETGGGQRVYLDASQALPRKPISFDVLGVILPGSKFIDMKHPFF